MQTISVSAQISTQKPPNPSESKQKILLKTQKFFLEHLDHLMESEQFKVDESLLFDSIISN